MIDRPMQSQLALEFSIPDSTSFDNFILGSNGQLVNDLKRAITGQYEQFLYIWGAPETGKSHLLQSACRHASACELTALYLPLREAEHYGPEILQSLETLDLLCIDDIDAIATNQAWEEALFHLYNRLRESSTRFVGAAGYSPLTLPIKLPDLQSRLSWGLSYQVMGLNDVEKRTLLISECERRGLTLSGETADYILKHTRRDLSALKALVDKLDRASLAAQRRLTIPFIKEYL